MQLAEKIFNIQPNNFEEIALEVFRYQAQNNAVYSQYINLLKKDVNVINSIEQIPFLPIELFKSHKVITGDKNAEKVFESSGTTGTITSKHFVCDLQLYKKSFTNCFNQFYGDAKDYCILALLPSYLERDNSSLVYMVHHLIEESEHPKSAFFLNDLQNLSETLKELKAQNQKVLLIGVTFALLDLAEQFPMDLANTIIMETGGMKGKRPELTREELHNILTKAFNVDVIHSEYGMTELLSQGYSKGKGIFENPNWMKAMVRDVYNPLSESKQQGKGALNVIDLANINSCSFIATNDLCSINVDNTFTINGRMDNAEIRGCNLMVL